MSLESLVALGSLAVALASLGVTVITVVSGKKEREKRDLDAEEGRRRAAVGLLIDRLEKVARVQNRPVFGRLWARPEVEFMLAIPRLNLILKQRRAANL